jgi:hypothetical protein
VGKVIFDISLSLDGFMTAANRRPEEPMGEGGLRLVEWAFGEPMLFGTGTRMFENLGGAHIALEPLATIQTPRATHLRLRMAR